MTDRSMWGIELTPEHPVDRVVELAVSAESEGFDTVLGACHYNNRDPFVTLSRIAAATEDVRVGPAAANPYETHPVALASRVATLQEVSAGRAVCGLGAGDRSTLRTLGIERDRPLRRVLETLQAARRLWAGERVDHDGTFAASDAGLNYDVDPIPVYVGAQGPDMLRMAGKHADGTLVNGAHPDDLSWAADRIREGLEERPGERGPLDVVAYASVSVAEDEAAAREAARPPVAFIAGGAPATVLDRHGLDRDRAAAVGEAIESGAFTEAFERVTDDMIDALAIAGSPAVVETGIEALLEHADSVVVGAPLGPDIDRALPLAGEVLRRVRS